MKGSLGFLVDERRMNVAITRAKHFLFVVGNARTLSKNEKWKLLIAQCQTSGKIVEFNSP
jgi:superfamily I DNA and/or RNA helicase